MNLLIHYQPGARGDFLASVLLNYWNEAKNGQVYPPKYKKIHHINHHNNDGDSWEDLKNFNGIKIRIDPGRDAYNLLLIEINHIIKNKKITNFSLDNVDVAYRAACYFLNNEMHEIDQRKKLFDYWINFSQLYNINFIEKFYYELTGTSLSITNKNKIINNINIQPKFDPLIENLSKLLQFEIDNNLINSEKYFNMFEELPHIEKFLDIKYYSIDKIKEN